MDKAVLATCLIKEVLSEQQGSNTGRQIRRANSKNKIAGIIPSGLYLCKRERREQVTQATSYLPCCRFQLTSVNNSVKSSY
jgi:hypothetical protein